MIWTVEHTFTGCPHLLSFDIQHILAGLSYQPWLQQRGIPIRAGVKYECLGLEIGFEPARFSNDRSAHLQPEKYQRSNCGLFISLEYIADKKLVS